MREAPELACLNECPQRSHGAAEVARCLLRHVDRVRVDRSGRPRRYDAARTAGTELRLVLADIASSLGRRSRSVAPAKSTLADGPEAANR